MGRSKRILAQKPKVKKMLPVHIYKKETFDSVELTDAPEIYERYSKQAIDR